MFGARSPMFPQALMRSLEDKHWEHLMAHHHGHGRGCARHGFGDWQREANYLEVLGTLSEKELTGYEVLQALEDLGSDAAEAEKVYPILQQQVDRGLVSTHTEEGKTRYALTEAGRSYLQENEEKEEADFTPFWAKITPEIHHEMHATRRRFFMLGRTLFRRAHTKGWDADKMKQILAIVNRALDEIKAVVA